MRCDYRLCVRALLSILACEASLEMTCSQHARVFCPCSFCIRCSHHCGTLLQTTTSLSLSLSVSFSCFVGFALFRFVRSDSRVLRFLLAVFIFPFMPSDSCVLSYMFAPGLLCFMRSDSGVPGFLFCRVGFVACRVCFRSCGRAPVSLVSCLLGLALFHAVFCVLEFSFDFLFFHVIGLLCPGFAFCSGLLHAVGSHVLNVACSGLAVFHAVGLLCPGVSCFARV